MKVLPDGTPGGDRQDDSADEADDGSPEPGGDVPQDRGSEGRGGPGG